jgi:hypothetical protein
VSFNLAEVKDGGIHGPLAGFRTCRRISRELQPNHAFHAWQREHNERSVTNGKHALRTVEIWESNRTEDVCCSFKVSAHISSKPEQAKVHHEGDLGARASDEKDVNFLRSSSKMGRRIG